MLTVKNSAGGSFTIPYTDSEYVFSSQNLTSKTLAQFVGWDPIDINNFTINRYRAGLRDDIYHTKGDLHYKLRNPLSYKYDFQQSCSFYIGNRKIIVFNTYANSSSNYPLTAQIITLTADCKNIESLGPMLIYDIYEGHATSVIRHSYIVRRVTDYKFIIICTSTNDKTIKVLDINPSTYVLSVSDTGYIMHYNELIDSQNLDNFVYMDGKLVHYYMSRSDSVLRGRILYFNPSTNKITGETGVASINITKTLNSIVCDVIKVSSTRFIAFGPARFYLFDVGGSSLIMKELSSWPASTNSQSNMSYFVPICKHACRNSLMMFQAQYSSSYGYFGSVHDFGTEFNMPSGALSDRGGFTAIASERAPVMLSSSPKHGKMFACYANPDSGSLRTYFFLSLYDIGTGYANNLTVSNHSAAIAFGTDLIDFEGHENELNMEISIGYEGKSDSGQVYTDYVVHTYSHPNLIKVARAWSKVDGIMGTPATPTTVGKLIFKSTEWENV